jgi:hypothetical protein
MLQRLTKILTNRVFTLHPKQRHVYAVTGGKYLGELLVFMKDKGSTYSFLSLPDMHIRDIPADKFKFGIKEHIVEVVERLPKYAYKACVAQYTKNTTQA